MAVQIFTAAKHSVSPVAEGAESCILPDQGMVMMTIPDDHDTLFDIVGFFCPPGRVPQKVAFSDFKRIALPGGTKDLIFGATGRIVIESGIGMKSRALTLLTKAVAPRHGVSSETIIIRVPCVHVQGFGLKTHGCCPSAADFTPGAVWLP